MSERRQLAPEGMDVVPRHMGLSFSDSIPRNWFAGDPWSTQMLNALSLTFPSGEQMFIDSVRHYRDRITDPSLQREVKGFTAQEAQHSHEHELFNRWIERQGAPVEEVYAWLDNMIATRNKPLPPIARLAVTCALEHFTAIMADSFLGDPEVLEAMHEDVRLLWMWHAIEETEHKAVAYDVFEAMGGTYEVRARTMALVTITFLINTTQIHQKLLRAAGEQRNFRSAARYFTRFWGPKGAFTKLIPAYLDYYRRDFHPWQHENRELIAKYKAVVEAKAKRLMPLAPVPSGAS